MFELRSSKPNCALYRLALIDKCSNQIIFFESEQQLIYYFTSGKRDRFSGLMVQPGAYIHYPVVERTGKKLSDIEMYIKLKYPEHFI